MNQRELPFGWAWTTLRDAAHIILGQSPPSSTYNDDGMGVPFYQGKAEFGDLYPIPVKWCSEPKKVAEAGDVLISVRAPVGPTNLCPERSCIGRGLAALRPEDDMNSRYFLYYLRLVEQEWAASATGTTFKAITGDALRNRLIPLPPLPEQHRMVAEIEKHLTRLDAGVAALKRAQAKLRRYRAAVLKAACEGNLVPQDPADEPAEELLKRILVERRAKWEADELTNMRARGKEPKDDRWKEQYKEPAPPATSDLPELPGGWVWTSVKQVAGNIQYGLTESAKEELVGPKFLRITDVQRGRVNWDSVPYCECSEEEHQKYCLQPGDIVFARTGATTGKSYLIVDCPDAVFASYLIRLQLSPWVEPKYMAQFLNSPIYWSQIMIARKGSAQPGVNANKLATLHVPIPPIGEQRRIVAEADRLLSVAQELEAAIETSLKRAERLRQAILRHAFEGKLVPQDPTDEPASVLLERIQAERAGRAPKKQGRKKKAAQQSQFPLL